MGYHGLLRAMEEEQEKVSSFESGWKSYLMCDPPPLSPMSHVELRGFRGPSKKNKKRRTERKKGNSGGMYGYQEFKLEERDYSIIALEKKPSDTVLLGYERESQGQLDLAFCYYLKSVEFEQDARGLYMLARYYEFGLAFIKKDLDIAREYYKKAACYGCVDAQLSVASYFESGSSSFPKDNREALKWYKIAADKQHPQALACLGNFYEHGIEVPKDLEEAFRNYSLSAARDNAWGHYLVGRAYLYGIGTKSDITRARHHLSRAAENKYPQGLLDLALYYEQNQQYGEAFNLYLEAAEKDMPEAYLKIAIFYEEGKGVLKDLNLAKYFYKKLKHNRGQSGF